MGDGALVSLDPQNGEVLAMVGTWNYADPYFGQVNEAARGPAEHGVDDQAVHLHGGDRVDQVHDDHADPRRALHVSDPGNPNGYSPFDDDRRTHGVCPLKMCLGNSFNIPAVKTEYATGTQYIANTELAMGVEVAQPELQRSIGQSYVNWPTPDQWAATLGSLTCGITLLDLADGAATLGDLGVQHNPMPVTSIIGAGDRADGLDVQRRGRRPPGDPRQRRVHHG